MTRVHALALAFALALAGCCCTQRPVTPERHLVELRATPLDEGDGSQVLIESKVYAAVAGGREVMAAPSLIINAGDEGSIQVTQSSGDGVHDGFTMRFLAERTEGGTKLGVRYAHWKGGRRVHRIPLTHVDVPAGETVTLSAQRVSR